LDIKKAVREWAENEFTKELALECDKNEQFPKELHKKAAEYIFQKSTAAEDSELLRTVYTLRRFVEPTQVLASHFPYQILLLS
jgi:HD superfamily phosphohydrolase YqeK